MRRYAVVVLLFALLAAAVIWAAWAWRSIEGPPLPATGYLAMGFGIFFSIVVGCGLMALVFYSARHGYDEAAQRNETTDGSDSWKQ
ncbi:MAG: hypothetical protein HY659_08045 [Rhizobiales bacterium]|nr:hypothetical protein [Hyphomicrobiales bacterium]